MIFIHSCSQDVSSDILAKMLKNEGVFRLDIDRIDRYSWDFNANGFSIEDDRGNLITNSTLTSFYLRKPMYVNDIDVPAGGCLENWVREEVQDIFNDLFRECERQGKTIIIHSHSSTYGKYRQLLAAKSFFNVDTWHIFHGKLPAEMREGRWVVKALTGASIGLGKMFMAKEVDPTALDLRYPWFAQRKIIGEEDVTVVYFNGAKYAALAKRSEIEGDDVRLSTAVGSIRWRKCDLSEAEENAIDGFMEETGYSFGRFDFIRKDGELWFLEMNPNGQWAWLDPDDRDGLITMIADAIKSEDAHHRAQLQK